MSYSDNDDFENMAMRKYNSQADLSDDDSVFAAPKNNPEDDDLELLLRQVQVNKPDPVKVAALKADIKKWEDAKIKAVQMKMDPVRISKVEKKIQDLKGELAALDVATSADVARLTAEISVLNRERAALTTKITAKTAQLTRLNPPELENKEDDQESLFLHMSAARESARRGNQYNPASSHVKITPPKETRDTNYGF